SPKRLQVVHHSSLPFGYTGQRRDDGTGGLMVYGARYYLPGIQHFISADTTVPGKASQVLNRYTYVFTR
ncbi:MAG: hypothetical protein JXB07_16690, partial [Anaerolineae bacterium]|nr:hypothetical protein [Anaerolineae bacterium]